MTSLWASDLHLNELARDQYRWEILPWLERTATELKVDFIGLGGDTADAKDRHPASFVNRLTDFFADSKFEWVILSGNHDYVEPNTPFFRYLTHLPNVLWIIEPTSRMLPVDSKKRKTLLLPSTRDWATLWPPLLDNQEYDYIFMHGTFAGTMSENGFELPGMPHDLFAKTTFKHLYAGDIHTPGPIAEGMEYIGAPYRVHFGDTYEPRVVYLGESDNQDSLFPGLKSRHVVVVRGLDDLGRTEEVLSGDQVKIRVRLKRSEFPEWRKIRLEILAEAARLEWEVCGIELLELKVVRHRPGEEPQEGATPVRKTPEEYLQDYAANQRWKKPVVDFGLTLLKG